MFWISTFCGLFLFGMIAYFGWRSFSGFTMREETLLLANRQVGLLALTATLVMTELNTSTLTAFASLGYQHGMWALFMPATFLLGLLFYAFVVAKKWRSLSSLSVAELFKRSYGKKIGQIASIMLMLATLGFTATHIKSLTLIMSPLFPWAPPLALSIGLILATLLISMPRGLISIVQTDVVSFCCAFIILPLSLYFTFSQSLQTPKEIEVLALSPFYLIPLILLTMFTYISSPWYGQKVFCAKSKKTAFLSTLASAILVFTLYEMVAMSGAYLRLSGMALEHPDMSLAALIEALPPLLRGIGYTTLFAIAATTLSGLWSAVVSMIIADFLGGGLSKDSRRWTGLSLLVAFVSLILANTLIDTIFPKLILANIPLFALSFALLAAFYWPKASRLSAIVSMSLGLFWGAFTYLYFGEENGYLFYWVVGGLPIIFGSGITTALLRPRGFKRETLSKRALLNSRPLEVLSTACIASDKKKH